MDEKVIAVSERLRNLVYIVVEDMEDMEIGLDDNLVDEVGVDSIEAFEVVATLHDVLGAEIPEDIDPDTISTLGQMSQFIVDHYTEEQVDMILSESFVDKVVEVVNFSSEEDDMF